MTTYLPLKDFFAKKIYEKPSLFLKNKTQSESCSCGKTAVITVDVLDSIH